MYASAYHLSQLANSIFVLKISMAIRPHPIKVAYRAGRGPLKAAGINLLQIRPRPLIVDSGGAGAAFATSGKLPTLVVGGARAWCSGCTSTQCAEVTVQTAEGCVWLRRRSFWTRALRPRDACGSGGGPPWTRALRASFALPLPFSAVIQFSGVHCGSAPAIRDRRPRDS